MNPENTENIDELGLSDRGVGVQAIGFTIVGCVSVAALQLFSDSDHLLYQWFEMAATRLYWAFVVPLAALFDWGRIMFAKGKAIREAKKAEVIARYAARYKEEGMQQGIKEERKRSNAKLRALAKEYGIPEDKLQLDPEDDE